MTSVDDAFDKLVHKNAISIPVAGSLSVACAAVTENVPPALPSPNHQEEVLPVMSLLGDYHPRGYDTDTKSFPTETDLSEMAEMDNFTDDTINHASFVAEDAGMLNKARMVQRFSYLPLADAEAFSTRSRDILASLASKNPDKPSLAIISPELGYGQTEIAIRMALAVAKRVDYRILLADFNVRQPQIAARLGISSKYFTISDVLRGSCPLGEALTYSKEDNLYVLPARRSDRDGDEILNTHQVSQLLFQLHSTFDFIIIGCGSMEHTDSTIICRHTGATALAAFCNRSNAKALREAAQRLDHAGIQVTGLLLTGAR